MQTWLDWEVSRLMPGILDGARQRNYQDVPPNIVKAGDFAVLRHALAADMMAIDHKLQSPEAQEHFRRSLLRGDRKSMALYLWLRGVLPFLGISWRVPAGRELCRAIRPSADLVEVLSHAHPPAGGQEAVKRELLKTACTYVDLPPRAIMVGDLQARCLFVNPVSTPEGDELLLRLILTDPGAYTPQAHLSWVYKGEDAPFGWSDERLDMPALAAEIDDFLTMVMLYRLTAANAHRGQLPHRDGSEIFGNPRRAAANAKKFSLFRVETLEPPPDRFGRAKAAVGEAREWRPGLAWRSTVKPHFKLQAHGPALSLRKLIFVGTYERGPFDAPRKQDLEIVEAPKLKM